MFLELVVGATIFLWLLYKFCGPSESHSSAESRSTLWQLYGNSSFKSIADQFSSLDQVTSALRKSGLESSNLIIGVDYTLSNHTQGTYTFDGKNLHMLGPSLRNPYQQVIQIVGETLSQFDEDNVIPAFGFGDLGTKDHSVFPLDPSGYCVGMDGVLKAYENVARNVRMSGPTSFAPLIQKAMEIVRVTRSYHILVIIADGQVTNENSTVAAIVEASNYPLSIVMVGVGDGPWDMMKEFDDRLPARRVDNFQFVEFHKIMTSQSTYKNPEAAFALQALMEIPDHYKTMRSLGMIGN